MSTNQTVFVVEDERDVADLVTLTLANFGYRVETFRTGEALKTRLRVKTPDICIVDLALPDIDGLELVKGFDNMPDVGVMVMTGRGDVADRVLGLEIGADDYLVKPFEPRELVARVNSLVRRLGRVRDLVRPLESSTARFSGFTFDSSSLTLVSDDGATESVSAAEAQLLMAFLRSPNRVLSRERLLDLNGAEEHSPFDRSIDVRISRLRKKLEDNPKEPMIIKTIYGAGYLFAASVEWA
ncbi:MAG: response regulator transcription factor [Magnetovibrionaceae bacterium]